jgi:uracil-DNA glycosylase
MNKPDTCRVCPAYGDGKGYVADELADGAPYLVVGGIPNKDAIAAGHPFSGALGDEYAEKYFPRGGVERGRNPVVTFHNGFPVWETDDGNVSFNYIIRCKGPATPETIAHCRQYDIIQETISLIVACGELAWSTTSDNAGKVLDWRGGITKRERNPRDNT